MHKTLFLGPKKSTIFSWLKSQNEAVEQTTEKLSASWLKDNRFDFLVSYGYRHIISPEVLRLFPRRAVNLHISYLPWNRGADPNIWSFFEDSPKGVTIHYIDEGIDTGNIIAQRYLEFDQNTETLASSYTALTQAIEALFMQYWQQIKLQSCPNIIQPSSGTYHAAADLDKLKSLLTEGWDTPVNKITQAGCTVKSAI